MDHSIVHTKIISYKNQNQHGENRNFGLSKEDYLSELSPSSINKLKISDFYKQKLFLQQMCVLQKMIPKQLMTIEEKYLRNCLELIHMNAIKLNFSTDENLIVNSSIDPIIGSITGSASMINLLNSPLLRQLNDTNDDRNYAKANLDSEDQIIEIETDEVLHKRIVSFSSTNSTFSDPSSSSSSSSLSSSSYSQGMLHCSWNNGFPSYAYSVEDQKEVYTTNLSRFDSVNHDFDYVYTFRSKTESDLVAKMSVSTSVELDPLGNEIVETRFILTANNHVSETSNQTSNQTVKRSKGITKKVANIFRHRTFSKFDGSFSIQESSLSKYENDETNFTESEFSSNNESLAIIVKDIIPCSEKKVEEVGGWGLKFLKEGGGKRINAGPMKHSSSMDVVVPMGFHGGPNTKNGGPLGLVERWKGGSCDCGGWDLGCPITILNSGSNNKDVLYKSGVFGKSNSFELFTQGCKQSLPVIEVTNVHDGLYYIHYQSTLSALQSFSIAVAIIHSHTPTLKQKVYKN